MAKQTPQKKEKSLEQRVQELILKKLFIKVNEDELIIDKVDFILLVLRDLIALAKSDFDLEKALNLALEENEEYREVPEIKLNQLKQSAVEFRIEAEAYRVYLISQAENKPDALILSEVHTNLNSEPELLNRKLREVISESLNEKITDDQVAPTGIDRWELISKYSDYTLLIAESESIDHAVDKLITRMNLSPEEFTHRQEALKEGMMRIAAFAGTEIDAIELAIIMREQNAEYYQILMKVKEELELDE